MAGMVLEAHLLGKWRPLFNKISYGSMGGPCVPMGGPWGPMWGPLGAHGQPIESHGGWPCQGLPEGDGGGDRREDHVERMGAGIKANSVCGL